MLFKTLAIVISFIPFLAAQNNDSQQKELKDKTLEINVTERNIARPTNKICPVKDSPVKDNVPAIIYNNKIIGFCCKGCDDIFLNNPKLYEDKLKRKDN